MARLVLFLSVLLSLKTGLALAQDKTPISNTTLLDVQPGERGVPETLKLGIHKLKYITAESASDVLREVMGKSVSVVVEPASQNILVRASESQIREAKAILDVLDQAPKMIAIEVLFADLPAPAKDSQSQITGGTSDEVWLERLKKQEGKTKGKIHKIRLTAVENQKAMIQYGEQTPVVAGVQRGFGGRGAAPTRTPVVRQTSVGTIVQCTARVSQDETIVAEFEIERSGFTPPEKATVLDESDDNGTLSAPGLMTTTCKTTLTLKPGRPRVVSGLKSEGAAKGTQSIIVITAELISLNE